MPSSPTESSAAMATLIGVPTGSPVKVKLLAGLATM
jgi:hypothetical protein